jgi:hypothetical protein
MATIDEIRRGIQVLEEKIVASEAKLEGLERQKNEDGLSNEAKKEIDGKIAFVRSDILLDKQQIVADKRWIVAEKEETAMKEKRITAKEQKEAAAKIIEARKGETSPFPDRTFPVPSFFNGMHALHLSFEVSLLPNLVTSTLVAALWTAGTTLAGLFIRWPIQFTANYPGLSNALSLFLHLTAACIAVANGLVGFLVNLVSRFWSGDAANEDNQGQGVENVVVGSTEEERAPLVDPASGGVISLRRHTFSCLFVAGRSGARSKWSRMPVPPYMIFPDYLLHLVIRSFT